MISFLEVIKWALSDPYYAEEEFAISARSGRK
jgi:hypothetical protein